MAGDSGGGARFGGGSTGEGRWWLAWWFLGDRKNEQRMGVRGLARLGRGVENIEGPRVRGGGRNGSGDDWFAAVVVVDGWRGVAERKRRHGRRWLRAEGIRETGR